MARLIWSVKYLLILPLYCWWLLWGSIAYAVTIDIVADKVDVIEGEQVTVFVTFAEEKQDSYLGCTVSFNVDSTLGTAVQGKDFSLSQQVPFSFSVGSYYEETKGSTLTSDTMTATYNITDHDGLEGLEEIKSAITFQDKSCVSSEPVWPTITIKDDGTDIHALNAQLVSSLETVSAKVGSLKVAEGRFRLPSSVVADANCKATMSVTAVGGTAVTGRDFTFTPVSGTFSQGESSKSIPIPLNVLAGIAGDGDKTLRLQAVFASTGGSQGNSCPLATEATQTIELVLKDTPIATHNLSANLVATQTMIPAKVGAVNVAEGRFSLPSSVVADANCKATMSVTAVGGTAVAGRDFTFTPVSGTFGQGESSKSIPVPLNVLTDIAGDGDKTLRLQAVFASTGGSQGNSCPLATEATQTIELVLKDTPLPTKHNLSALLVGTQLTLNEKTQGKQKVAELRFALPTGIKADANCHVTASVRVSGGTAKQGTDFEFSNVEALFSAADGNGKVVPIDLTVLPGMAGDGNKTIELQATFQNQASGASSCTLTSATTQTLALNIVDDPNDPLVAKLSASKTSAIEGETIQVNLTFSEASMARLVSAGRSISSCNVAAKWSLNGTAIEGKDYTFAPPNSILYQKADPTIAIPLKLLTDNMPEETKTLDIGVMLLGAGNNPCPLSGANNLTLSKLALKDGTNLVSLSPVEPEELGTMACSSLRTKAGTTDTATNRDALALEILKGNDRAFYASNCVQNVKDRNFEPEEIAAQANAVLLGANRQLNNVRNRLEKLRTADGRGVDISNATLNIQGNTVPLGGAAGDDNSLFANSRWGVFANGEYAFGKKERGNDRKTASGDRNFDFNSSGATVGIDYRMPGEKLVLGGALGYKKFDADFMDEAGNTKMDGYTFSVYSTYLPSPKTYIDSIISFGNNELTSRRPVNNDGSGNIGTQTTYAIGKPDAKELSLSVGGGYEFTQGKWTITPYGRVDYVSGKIDAFTETASHSSANTSLFSFEEQHVKSLTSAIGVRASQTYKTSRGVFVPQASVEWKHEFKDRGVIAGQSIYINNSGLNLSPQFVEKNSDNFDKNYFNLSAGVSVVFPKGKSGYINFESRQGDDSIKDNAIKAGFRWEF